MSSLYVVAALGYGCAKYICKRIQSEPRGCLFVIYY